MFALGEYLTVSSNIGFHGGSLIIDFGDLDFIAVPSSLDYRDQYRPERYLC